MRSTALSRLKINQTKNRANLIGFIYGNYTGRIYRDVSVLIIKKPSYQFAWLYWLNNQICVKTRQFLASYDLLLNEQNQQDHHHSLEKPDQNLLQTNLVSALI